MRSCDAEHVLQGAESLGREAGGDGRSRIEPRVLSTGALPGGGGTRLCRVEVALARGLARGSGVGSCAGRKGEAGGTGCIRKSATGFSWVSNGLLLLVPEPPSLRR